MTLHLQQCPELFGNILSTLFEVVLFEDCSNQWSLSRPMLSVILINEPLYSELRARIVATQPLERRSSLSPASMASCAMWPATSSPKIATNSPR